MFNGLKEKIFSKNNIKDYYILYSKIKLPLVFMKKQGLYKNNLLNFKIENKNDIQNAIINNIKIILKFTSNFDLNEKDENIPFTPIIPFKSTPINSLEYSKTKLGSYQPNENFSYLCNNIPLQSDKKNLNLYF